MDIICESVLRVRALSRYTRTAPWDEEHIPCSAQSSQQHRATRCLDAFGAASGAFRLSRFAPALSSTQRRKRCEVVDSRSSTRCRRGWTNGRAHDPVPELEVAPSPVRRPGRMRTLSRVVPAGDCCPGSRSDTTCLRRYVPLATPGPWASGCVRRCCALVVQTRLRPRSLIRSTSDSRHVERKDWAHIGHGIR